MATFTGQLNTNEIFGALYNMIISQEVFADNIKGTFSELVDRARVDGGLYGDTKLYYATDVLKSRAWGNDGEAKNLLNINRPKAPSTQAIVLDTFRQIDITVDYYLSKRAWQDEGAFSSFNSVILGWIRETKRVYDSTLYNAYIGNTYSNAVKGVLEVSDLAIIDSDEELNREGKARLEAQTIAQALADLFVELRDVNRDYNDYGYLRSYAEDDLIVVWNSAFVNKIAKIDLPTIFHKEGLVEKFEQYVLPAKYFGDIVATDHTSNAGERATYEAEYEVSEEVYHVFAGQVIPTGASVDAGGSYIVNPDIICKVIHRRSVPFMSAFEVGTSFFNPRSLTENHYLTWGHNTLEYLKDKPFITIKQPASYAITYTITHGTAEGVEKLMAGGSAKIRIVGEAGYVYPTSVSVSGATKVSYNSSNGELVIANPTGAITITATCPSA